MDLFFDIETTGIPQTISFGNFYDYKEIDRYNGSRVLSFAFFLSDESNEDIKMKCSHVIYPDNFTIANHHIHGITPDIAKSKGVNFEKVIPEVEKIIASPIKVIVGHNINFDIFVFCSELHRRGYQELASKLFSLKRYCTMKNGVDITQIPGFRGNFKVPKLQELYYKLFEEEFQNAHNAEEDTIACMKCYYKMIK